MVIYRLLNMQSRFTRLAFGCQWQHCFIQMQLAPSSILLMDYIEKDISAFKNVCVT